MTLQASSTLHPFMLMGGAALLHRRGFCSLCLLVLSVITYQSCWLSALALLCTR